jgi:hypothetical protein
MDRQNSQPTENPLSHLDDWDDDVRRRYGTDEAPKAKDRFREYSEDTRAGASSIA